MCDLATAATVASVASTAAGTLLNIDQANRQRRAQEEQIAAQSAARLAEMARQDELARRSNARWNRMMQRRTADNMQGEVSGIEQQVMNTYNVSGPSAESGLANVFIPGQENASSEIRERVAGEVARGAQDARARTAALARLVGYQGALQRQDSRNVNLDAQMALDRSLSRGSLGIYGLEGSRPMAYVPDNGLGAILTGVGGIAGRYAGRNWNNTPALPSAIR